MATIKTTLDTRRIKSDGTFNIIFRITHIRKIYTINSGISVPKPLWCSKENQVDTTHPNSKLLNIKIFEKHYKIQHALLVMGDDFSIVKLKRVLDGEPNESDHITFQSFAKDIIDQMMEVKRTGNALVYQTGVNRLIDYAGNNITFEDIDYDLLDRFIHHLKASGLKQNSIANYLRSIRAIYNKAIKKKIVSRGSYPFYDISIKSEKTIKRAISRENMKRLLDITTDKDSTAGRSLDYFVLSFYLRGISFTDLAYLKQTDLIDGRICYIRRKTNKHYSIKLFSSAEDIINRLNQQNSIYLLPILNNEIIEDSLQAKKVLKQWIKTTNKYLQRLMDTIDPNISITTYTSRHAFATIAKKMGYSNELIAESLGHEYGNKITNIYLDAFDTNKLDEMHLKVISL